MLLSTRTLIIKERKLADFIVHGPYDIPVTKGSRGGRIITKENGKTFFEIQSHVALDIGVYVIALRNRGTVPIYVGKNEPFLFFVFFLLILPGQGIQNRYSDLYFEINIR